MNTVKLFEDFFANQIKSINELKTKLQEYSVPIDFWGTGESKTIEHLFDELQNDECTIVDEGGYLVRYIEFVGIRIFYKDQNNQIWALIEDRQEFKDGRVRRRKMPSSVSEKMKFGEDSLISAIRGIQEELEITVTAEQLIKHRPLYYNGGSQSYPGLKAKYKGHQYTCYFDETQFRPRGYVEIQKDKSTFFKWIKKELLN